MNINSKAVRFFLIFMALSFVLLSASDFIFGFSISKPIIKINSQKVSQKEFQRILETNKRNIYATYGSSQEIINMLNGVNYKVDTLNNLVTEMLLQEFARQTNINPNKEFVYSEIIDMPYFKNADGRFDEVKFNDFLKNRRIFESDFIEEQSKQIARNNLLKIFSTKHFNNKKLAKYIQNKENINKKIDLISIKTENLVKEKYSFNKKDKEDYYNQNQSKFYREKEILWSYIDFDFSDSEDLEANIGELQDDILLSSDLADIAKKYNAKIKSLGHIGESNISNYKWLSFDLDILNYSEGEFSNPINMKNGIYRVMFLHTINEAKYLSLDESNSLIEEFMTQERDEGRVEEFANRIYKQAKNSNLSMVSLRYGLDYKENLLINKNSKNIDQELKDKLLKSSEKMQLIKISDKEYQIAIVKSEFTTSKDDENYLSLKEVEFDIMESVNKDIYSGFIYQIEKNNSVTIRYELLK